MLVHSVGEVEEDAADNRQVQKHQRDKNSFHFSLPVTVVLELLGIGMMRTVPRGVQFAL